MNAPTHHEERLFARLIALPAPERAVVLEEEVEGDAALRMRLEQRLRAYDQMQGGPV